MRRTPEDIQDELLVLRSQDGDRHALRELVERFHPRMSRLAWRLTVDAEAARDIAQDAWLAIVRGLRRLDDPERFRAWAYRIVSNKCADWTRRRVLMRRADAQQRETVAEAVGQEQENDSEVMRLRGALAALPAGQRAILSLHYLDGMAVAEISSVLQIPAGTVKSRLFHARKRLKQALERTET